MVQEMVCRSTLFFFLFILFALKVEVILFVHAFFQNKPKEKSPKKMKAGPLPANHNLKAQAIVQKFIIVLLVRRRQNASYDLRCNLSADQRWWLWQLILIDERFLLQPDSIWSIVMRMKQSSQASCDNIQADQCSSIILGGICAHTLEVMAST